MDTKIHLKGLRFLLILFFIACLFSILKYTFIFIYPFIIALVIAFFLNPIITYMQSSWKMNRTIATSLIMCSFFIFMFTIGFFIIKRLINESSMLVESLPEQVQQLKTVLVDVGQTFFLPLYEKVMMYIPFFPAIEQFSIPDYLETLIDDLGQSSLSILSNFVGTASNIVSSITYMVTIIIFILLASFMITKDFNHFKTASKSFIPQKVMLKFGQIKMNVKRSVFGFMKAQITITFITSIIVFIGLLIFQVDHLFMMTLLVFFVDFIPYVGIGAVFIPWIIYQFFMEQFVLTIQLSILYIIVIIVRQVIEPKILASSIGIHPLFALLILFISLQSLGIIGIFITPIILILLSAIYHARIFHFLWDYIKNG